MKVGRSRGSSPIRPIAVVMAVFVILILIAEASSLILQQAVMSYYLAGRPSNIDGVVVECPRSWVGQYVLFQYVAPNQVCPNPGDAFGGVGPYDVTNQSVPSSIAGVALYPIYESYSMVLLSDPNVNSSLPLQAYGLGYSATMDVALQSALVSGSLPTGSAGYGVLVTDTTASMFNLTVGETINIQGIFRDVIGNTSLTMFAKPVTVEGILTSSKLFDEFNVGGVRMFTADLLGTPTLEDLGSAPPTPCSMGPEPSGFAMYLPFLRANGTTENFYFTSKILASEAFCADSSQFFGVFSNNFLNDLYGTNITAPSELAFRFTNLPTSPSDLLQKMSDVQSAFPPYLDDVSLTWRADVALVEFTFGSPGSIGPAFVYDNATVAAASQNQIPFPPNGGVGVAFTVPPIVARILTIRDAAGVLALYATTLVLLIEIAAFYVVRRAFFVATEVYKAHGLTRNQALLQLLRSHAVSPSLLAIGSLVPCAAAAVLLGTGLVYPLILVSSFLLLVFLQFALLTTKSYASKGVGHLKGMVAG